MVRAIAPDTLRCGALRSDHCRVVIFVYWYIGNNLFMFSVLFYYKFIKPHNFVGYFQIFFILLMFSVLVHVCLYQFSIGMFFVVVCNWRSPPMHIIIPKMGFQKYPDIGINEKKLCNNKKTRHAI